MRTHESDALLHVPSIMPRCRVVVMGLGGALSIVFGALVVYAPGAGALTLVWLFAFYAILVGITEIGLGFRLRGLGQSLPQTQAAAASPSR